MICTGGVRGINYSEIQTILNTYFTRRGFHGKNEPTDAGYRLIIGSEIFGSWGGFKKGQPAVYFTGLYQDENPIKDMKAKLNYFIEMEYTPPEPYGIAVELVDAVAVCLDYMIENRYTYNGEGIPASLSVIDSEMFYIKLFEMLMDYEYALHHTCRLIINSILTFFEQNKWDFLSIYRLKQRYNDSRLYQHGQTGGK